MKAKRQTESSLNSVTMLDGSGGHVRGVTGRGLRALAARGECQGRNATNESRHAWLFLFKHRADDGVEEAIRRERAFTQNELAEHTGLEQTLVTDPRTWFAPCLASDRRIRTTNPGQGRAAFHRAGVSGATSDSLL
jgi:hypothetical protein